MSNDQVVRCRERQHSKRCDFDGVADKFQPTGEKYEIESDLGSRFSIVLFLTLFFIASAIVRAQADAPFIEMGLPGPAFSGVVPPDGRLYGVTYEGGSLNQGTLYSVDTALSAVTVHVNFNGTNGAIPYDELTYDAASARFYGTTDSGGGTIQGTNIFIHSGGERGNDAQGRLWFWLIRPAGSLAFRAVHLWRDSFFS